MKHYGPLVSFERKTYQTVLVVCWVNFIPIGMR